MGIRALKVTFYESCFCFKKSQSKIFIYYRSGRVSPTFIRCLYAVFGYKHFLTAMNYLWQPYTTLGGYILLSMAIYYFRRLYTTFDGYVFLLTVIYYFQPYLTVILYETLLKFLELMDYKLGLISISICQPQCSLLFSVIQWFLL